MVLIYTLRLGKNCRYVPDDIFKCILLNDSVLILNKIPLKFVPKTPINNIPAMVQIMAWCLYCLSLNELTKKKQDIISSRWMLK